MSSDLRPAAAVMLLNAEGKVFVAQRRDSSMDAWQMPQGGLDDGEDPEAGALRELEEETGIVRAKVEIVARASRELIYELPEDLRRHVWKGRWRGQRQWWFLARFLGTEADIDLETAEPEFRTYQWVDPHNGMIYVVQNALPILIAAAFSIALAVIWYRRALPIGATITLFVAQAWLAAILAGALILAPPKGGVWTMTIGSAVVIWAGFVAPAIVASYRVRAIAWRRAGQDAAYWLVAMVVQAVVMRLIGLTAPPS